MDAPKLSLGTQPHVNHLSKYTVPLNMLSENDIEYTVGMLTFAQGVTITQSLANIQAAQVMMK